MSVNLSKSTPATAQQVREWASRPRQAAKFGEVKPGRLPFAVVEAYNKVHAAQYTPALRQPSKVVKVVGKRADKSGRNRTVTYTVTIPEVREWAKGAGFDLGDVGRIPAEVFDAYGMREAAPAKG